MFANLSTFELLFIAAVLFLLFGGKKLPELARGVTKATQEFKKGLQDDDEGDSKKTK